MNGWFGKILRINLNKKQWEIEKVSHDILIKFIGGRGLAGYYLRPFIKLAWDNPEMPLLLFTGPLVNTISPTSGRMTFMSRSPLTETIGDSSVGGNFGSSLKRAGIDGIIITGRSEKLCGIEIFNDSIIIVEASNLKGNTISQIKSKIKDKGGSFAAIGPAAENGVMFSNIIIDGHFAAGRNGLGLIFASKNLKYIVINGNIKTSVADKDLLKQAREDVLRLISASPALSGEFGISKFGTAALYDLISVRDMMPTQNFKKTNFKWASLMNASAIHKKYNPQKTGCHGCNVLCKKKTASGIIIPEYETLSHFSALIDNNDIETVICANEICNEMGMDTISAAATLAVFLEISGNKLEPKDILQTLLDIAMRKGLGAELGLGSKRFAEKNNKSESSITVKKQELPAYDPRGAYGMALSYATSTRGACHLRAYPISHEILRKPVATDRFSFQGKARMIKIGEDINAAIDSLTACKFIFFAATLEEYAKIFSAVTGIKIYGQDLLNIGERIFYNERIMNAENGFNSKDDDLPKRFFEKSQDILKPLNRKDFLKALQNYYIVRGLDEMGLPTQETKIKLDLN